MDVLAGWSAQHGDHTQRHGRCTTNDQQLHLQSPPPPLRDLEFGTVLTWPVDYVTTGGHLASLNWHGLSVNYAPNAGAAHAGGSYATGVTYHPNGSIKTSSTATNFALYRRNVRQLPERIVDFRGSSPKYLDTLRLRPERKRAGDQLRCPATTATGR